MIQGHTWSRIHSLKEALYRDWSTANETHRWTCTKCGGKFSTEVGGKPRWWDFVLVRGDRMGCEDAVMVQKEMVAEVMGC